MVKQPPNYQFFTDTQSTWEAMRSDLLSAQKSIFWESYIFHDDEIGRGFVEILKQKAMAGVEVKLAFDGWGGFWFTNEALKQLRATGAEILYFNPIELSYLWKGVRHWLNRNHRKLLLIDERVGYIGGVNIFKTCFEWLDLQVRVEGKIVRTMVKYFAHSWLAGGGRWERLKAILYLPVISERYWRVLWHKPRGQFSSLRNVYLNAINRARKTLTVVNPYFLPDREFLNALIEAKKRGVRVELIIPWRTNHNLLNYAMRAYWRMFASAGFKLFLMKRMIHAKALMVDDKWAMVGSSNFDAQSFYRSHESNLIFTQMEMLADLKKIFSGWKSSSRLFQPLQWSRRGFIQRLWEILGRILRPIL